MTNKDGRADNAKKYKTQFYYHIDVNKIASTAIIDWFYWFNADIKCCIGGHG